MLRESSETYRAPSATRPGGDSPNGPWWRLTGEEAAREMVGRATRIYKDQSDLRDDWLDFSSLYAGQKLTSLYSFGSRSMSNVDWRGYTGVARCTWNLVQACVETAETRATQTATRPRIQTFGGDQKQQRSAELLQKWIDGWFYEQRFESEINPFVFLDGALHGGGIPRVDWDRNGVNVHRILPFEWLVDEWETARGNAPRNAFACTLMPRDQAEDLYADTEAKRMLISQASGTDELGRGRGDLVRLYEGIHVDKEPKKSRRLIAVSGGALADEVWPLDRLPVPRKPFRYGLMPGGWWGQPLVFRLVGSQLEINTQVAKIREVHRKMVGSHWWVPIGSDVRNTDLINGVGTVIRGNVESGAPVPLIVPGLPAESYQHLQAMWERGFDLAALNEMAVSGDKPAGVTAAEAFRELRINTNIRFTKIMERFDQTKIEIADLAIAVARHAFADKEKSKEAKQRVMRAPGTRLLEKIDWANIDMEEDSYVVREAISSALPQTPAARRQRLVEMAQQGTISKEAADALSELGDVETALAPGVIQWNEAKREIDRLLDGDEYRAPDEALSPPIALGVGTAAYLQALHDGAPAKPLANVLRWVDDLRDRAKAQAAEAIASMPAPAPGPGGAPPRADVLPTA